MAQSSSMSAVQFIVRIALAIANLRKKKEPPKKRLVQPPPLPEPSWSIGDHGFLEYSGVSTSLKPVLPQPLDTVKTRQEAREGTRAFIIWRDMVSKDYFNDLRAMLGVKQERGEEK